MPDNLIITGGGVSVKWSASPAKLYQLQYTTDLSSNVWTDLGYPVIATSGQASITDAPGILEQRFYRVVRLDY